MNARIGPSVFYQAVSNKRISAAISSKVSAAGSRARHRRVRLDGIEGNDDRNAGK
jgi:hypothetical protein